MPVLDRLPEISERLNAARKTSKPGDKNNWTGASESAPILSKGQSPRIRPLPNTPERDPGKTHAAPKEKAEQKSVSLVRPRGLMSRIRNAFRAPERATEPRDDRLANAGSGADNFFAGQTDPIYPAKQRAGKGRKAAPIHDLETESPTARKERTYSALALNLFNELDVNGDGVLSQEELRPIWDRISIADLDINGDGVVNLREFLSNYRTIERRGRQAMSERAEREGSKQKAAHQDERAATPRERARDDGPVR